ncbi:MAG: SnoaL-like domain [Thermoleophilaceae bacterium]|jgi:ketosteroid isomerase-like protein|nr:SnoaL-like domain [Thermoleophilaceae bacterium]
MDNLDVIRELARRWNAGDMDEVIGLYAEDAVTRTGAHWPEQATYQGRDAIRASIEEWQSMWEMTLAEVDSLEEYGDKVVATGAWQMRGRSSGVDGQMPIAILFTIRDGKIATLEWFPDRDHAVAAAHRA